MRKRTIVYKKKMSIIIDEHNRLLASLRPVTTEYNIMDIAEVGLVATMSQEQNNCKLLLPAVLINSRPPKVHPTLLRRVPITDDIIATRSHLTAHNNIIIIINITR